MGKQKQQRVAICWDNTIIKVIYVAVFFITIFLINTLSFDYDLVEYQLSNNQTNSVIIILISVLILRKFKYKDDMGNRDMWTLANLYGEINGVVITYDNGELNEETMIEYRGDLMILARYAQL